MKKTIRGILKRPPQPGMVGDGFRVYNYFPGGYRIRDMVDPFLMLDFNPEYDFGPSTHPRGVDVHPHKGFETVTIAYKGSVAHHDSRGNSGVIHPGDVQWMTAGGGILHKEYHETEFSKRGGPFEMVQLWVNLPKKHKLTPAHYQALEASQMGRYALPENSGTVNVIAGEIMGVKGPAKTFTPINLFNMHLKQNAFLKFDVSALHNTCLLIVNGSAFVNGSDAVTHDLVLFANEGEEIEINSSEDSLILFMSGEPIKEPVAQYGPFVMNTQEELYVAIDEFNAGKFGQLE